MDRNYFSKNIRVRLVRGIIAGSGVLVIAVSLFVRFSSAPTSALLESHPKQRGPSSNDPAFHALCENVYRAICNKRGSTRDPTGAVHKDAYGEIQALRIYEEIVRKHPDWGSEKVDDELVRNIYTPEHRKKFQEIFEWVQKTIIEFIRQQPDSLLALNQKRLITDRVKRIVLNLPPPASAYKDEPDLFTKNDVYYERPTEGPEAGTLRLRVGGAYFFTAKSRFNIIFTLAHETAHSIDPCEIRNEPISGSAFQVYQILNSCFIRQGLVANRPLREECGPKDQSSETFADWVAVHVVAQALKTFTFGYSPQDLANAIGNSVRDLCEQDDPTDEPDFEFHPTPQVRIEWIFGRNPAIRELIGCPTHHPEAAPYCTFSNITH